MGCASSVSSRKGFKHNSLTEPHEVRFPLSAHQKVLIRYSWKLLQSRRTEIGVKVFIRLFEMEPELQNMFSEFKELKHSELAGTRELHGHTERVMRAVENSVNAMDDPDCLRAYLRELGRRHVYRSAKPSVRNLNELSKALTCTFQEIIPSVWVPEVASAWELLLNFNSLMIKQGMFGNVCFLLILMLAS